VDKTHGQIQLLAKFKSMSANKKNLPEFKIKDRGGDLTKTWFVEYYAPNRTRKYGTINQHDTEDARPQIIGGGKFW
jgi:hypothetical protein